MTETPDYSVLMPAPQRWQRVTSPMAAHPDAVDLGAWIRRTGEKTPLRAIVSVDLYPGQDGHWLHVSLSRRSRLPTWADVVLTLDELGYADRAFVQLVPPKRAWLNVHSYCLHVHSRIDGETVPTVLWDQVGATGEGYRDRGTLIGGKVT